MRERIGSTQAMPTTCRPKEKSPVMKPGFFVSTQALSRVPSPCVETQAARFGLVADAALTAVLVIAWKLASATSTACFDALCTLS